MTLYTDIKYWLQLKMAKDISADDANKIATSEQAFRQFMIDIRRNAEAGLTEMHYQVIPSQFIDKAILLGYTIDSKSQISWKRDPTIEDIDARINELTELRDELKKEQLVKKLSGIGDV